eukprot:c20298_g1_i4 orf=147-482(-)
MGRNLGFLHCPGSPILDGFANRFGIFNGRDLTSFALPLTLDIRTGSHFLDCTACGLPRCRATKETGASKLTGQVPKSGSQSFRMRSLETDEDLTIAESTINHILATGRISN